MQLERCTHVLVVSSLAIAFVAVVASCGSDEDGGQASSSGNPPGGNSPPSPPQVVPGIETSNETPGTRLEPSYYKLAGGDGSLTLRLHSWFDKERNELCEFQKLADDKMHCAPKGETADFFESSFQDAACTQPVVGVGRYIETGGRQCFLPTLPPATKRYIQIPAPSSCASVRLAELPATAPLAVTQIYVKQPDGKCLATPLDPKRTWEIYATPSVLTAIEPASFVTMNSSDDTPVTAARLRLSRTRYAGSDGSASITWGRIVDAQRNEFCSNQGDVNGVRRCMPDASFVTQAGDFSDAACTTRTFSVHRRYDCSGDARSKIFDYLNTSAGTSCQTELLAPFDVTPSKVVYTKTQAACVAKTLSTDSSASTLQFAAATLPNAIDPNVWVPLTTVIEDETRAFYGKNGSRIVQRSRGDVTPNGDFKLLAQAAPYDKELDAFCIPATLQDGKTYCAGYASQLEFATPTSFVYANTLCTDRIVGVEKPSTQCRPLGELGNKRRLVSAGTYAANGCQTSLIQELPAQPAVVPNLYRRKDDGTCTAVSATETEKYDLYRPSDLTEVNPTSFVPMDATLSRAAIIPQ